MNPYLHPRLSILWLTALALKALLTLRLFPRRDLPRFLFPFVAWAFLWTTALVGCAFTLADIPYVVTYWAGLHLSNILATALTLSIGCRVIPRCNRPNLSMAWFAGILALAATGWTVYRAHPHVAEWELFNNAAQLWLLGVLFLLAIAADRVQAKDRAILHGLLVLYASGWIVAGWQLVLPAYLTPSRPAMWGVDLLADIAVFAYWLIQKF